MSANVSRISVFCAATSRPVVIQPLRCEVERGFRHAVVLRTEAPYTFAELRVVSACIAKMKEVGHGEDGDVIAHWLCKFGLLTEGDGSHVGVQAVCAYNEVKAVRAPAAEGYVHPFLRLRDRLD